MKNIFYIISVLTVVWSCNVSSSKENTPSKIITKKPEEYKELQEKVSAFMNAFLLSKGFNGSILIAKNDQIIYEKYFGRVDLRKKDPLTENSALQLASASKTFTAVAILKMVQDTLLSLNDSLTKFFPGFPYPGITVRMLLTHRSGLPNYVYFIPNSDWNKNKYVTNKDVLNLLYTEKPHRSYMPDTRFSYSNTNFVLLALIIEKISGKAFPDYMKDNFFQPLKMDHTYIFTLADSASSTPSFNYNNRFWENDFLELTYGDKNIYSTPQDLFKWSVALFSGNVINKSWLDSAFTPHEFVRKGSAKKIGPIRNYGLGFRMLLMPNGKKIVYHFGRWHGFNAVFARLTDEKVTIIILGNKFNRNIYNAARKSYNLFGDYLPHQNSDEEETEELNPAKEKAREVPVKAARALKKRHSKN